MRFRQKMTAPKDLKTDGVQPESQPERPLDAADRRILAALVADAALSYAALGERVGLSAPAAHERVKRLRRSGRIRGAAAQIDPLAVGKPVLAFIEVTTTGWAETPSLDDLRGLPEVEEIHTVAGDACLIVKARCADTRALKGLLERLYAMPIVTRTRTTMVLSTLLERPVQAEVTPGLENAGRARSD